MWPISFETAKKKMRQYSSKKKPTGTNPILPQIPTTYHKCESALNEFINRVP